MRVQEVQGRFCDALPLLIELVAGTSLYRERDQLSDRILRAAPAKHAAYFAAVIESTWIVLVLVSSVPTTLTFRAANCSGVCWSLSV
jgi:hypothetical protein